MARRFTATHIITADGISERVKLVDGALYTKGEWNAADLADWTLNEDGELEFQGSVIYPYRSVELRQLG